MVRSILRNPFSRETYKRAYSDAARTVGVYLSEQYRPLMQERVSFYSKRSFGHEKTHIIWFCWLQGLSVAPEMVKRCHESLLKYLPDREVKVIDGENWKTYVELPEYIIEKWEKRQIPPAHFADLLRVELLIRYGGTWIDSTVLCTGLKPQNEKETLSFLDANLFMFQYSQPGSSQWRGISNWFISACSNNDVLMVLRDMLFAYWKDYDCMVDYYIFHLFFSMLREVYPHEIAAMPYGYSMWSLTLGYHWGEKFDPKKWKTLTSKVCFHKLSYNVRKKVKEEDGNYYHYILDGNV